ncbi:hypothetical protein P4V43_18630 [Brevibacillus fortis]|uniref:hypothetical protein n=1 Tax=Brevibacillus fortis TaxID=2126352 RepID=UPI002E1DE56F|nr:hypothetical protein [Brevibacillus fortis]
MLKVIPMKMPAFQPTIEKQRDEVVNKMEMIWKIPNAGFPYVINHIRLLFF